MHNNKLQIALFGNIYQESGLTAVSKVLDVAGRLGADVLIQQSYYEFLSSHITIPVPPCRIITDDFRSDVVVCIGGDGTFLDVASRVGARQIPILGINTGRLGFLANFSTGDIESALTAVACGRYTVEHRNVIMIESDDIELQGIPSALNEIAILKHDISAMITIHTSVDGEYLTTYQADGLIVGTPTGSTAYSLSVGGPIVVPGLSALTLTPVAPHSLNMRPIMLHPLSEVELKVKSRSGSFLVSLDGRSTSYHDNISLRIHRAPYTIDVINHPNHTFFSTLREKMKWGIDERN